LFLHGLVSLYPHCSTRPWRRIRRFAALRNVLHTLSHIRYVTLLKIWYNHPLAKRSRPIRYTCVGCRSSKRALADCEFLNGCLGGLPILSNSLLVFRETGWRRRQLAIMLNVACVGVWLRYLSGKTHSQPTSDVSVFWSFTEYREVLAHLTSAVTLLNRYALMSIGQLDSAGNLPLP
jgi:hypothetical protein